MTPEQINDRAWNLYRQIQNQQATLADYADTLGFVRVRQMSEGPVEEIARKLWEIACRMQGDMDPDFR